MILVCVRAVASAARKGLSSSNFRKISAIPSKCCRVLGLIRCYSGDSSVSSTPLIYALSEKPNSLIKATLEAELEGNSAEFSWEALVTSLGSVSPQKVRLVLEWRLEKLLKVKERNSSCYSELVSICGNIKNAPLAMQVFTSMEAVGMEPTSGTFNALIYACLSSANLLTALSLFEVMKRSSRDGYKPNAETYNIFISAYANLGDEKAMQAWHSARKDAGFSDDVHTYESLICGFFKSKNFDGVDRFYEEMLLSGITPNVPILEKMLAGHCERGSLVKAKEFLKFIVGGGWEFNQFMAEKLVRLYCNLGKLEEMEELLATLMESNQALEILSLVHCGIIRMYAKLDRLDDVEYSVGRMLRQRISFRSSEDVDKVISSYFRRAAYDRLELFLECIRHSYKLVRSNYDLLAAGYRRAGISEKLDMVINDMKLAGFL
ncbi:hypothetical protein NMG60_11027905 [Bertholletia excelsa]